MIQGPGIFFLLLLIVFKGQGIMFMGRKKEEVKGINWNDTERINDKRERKNTLEESTETRFLKEKYQQQIDLKQ